MDAGALPKPRMPLGRRAAFSAVLYASVLSIYFAAGHVARPPFLRLATPVDDWLPFVPAAMVGYALAYVVPFSLLWVELDEPGVRRMCRAVLTAYVIAAAFFVVMPVADADPPLEPSDSVQRLLEINRDIDQSKNAFPSMHVGLAVLLSLIAGRRSPAWGIALGAAAVVIAISTLLVKQHFLVDLPAGAVVAWIAYRSHYGPRGGLPPTSDLSL